MRFGGWGSILAGLGIVAALGFSGGMYSAVVYKADKSKISRLVNAFVLSLFSTSLIQFSVYYIEIGCRDPYLSVGIILSIVEFSGDALVGGIATCIGTIVAARKTCRE